MPGCHVDGRGLAIVSAPYIYGNNR